MSCHFHANFLRLCWTGSPVAITPSVFGPFRCISCLSVLIQCMKVHKLDLELSSSASVRRRYCLHARACLSASASKALIDYALGLALQRSSHQHLTGCLGTEVGVTRRSSCAPHVSRGQRMVSPKKYEERAADGPASSLPRQRHSLFEELEKCQGQQPPRSGSTAPWRSASRSRRTVAADASAAWRGPGTPGRNSGSAPTASRSLCRAC